MTAVKARKGVVRTRHGRLIAARLLQASTPAYAAFFAESFLSSSVPSQNGVLYAIVAETETLP